MLKGATEKDVRDASRLIGRKLWLAARRSNVINACGTGAERLADMASIMRELEIESACASAVQRAVLRAIDDQVAGVNAKLEELGIRPSEGAEIE